MYLSNIHHCSSCFPCRLCLRTDKIPWPKILSLYENSTIQSTGNMLHLFGFGFARDKGVPNNPQRNEIEQIGYASGTCLFTSKEVFKRVGLFDSFLFLYHDDLDLCWRAAMQGISSHYVPRSIVYHPPEGFSFKWSTFKYYLLERNRQYCLLTHYSRSTLYKMLPALIVVDIAVFFFYLKKRMLKKKIQATLSILKNWNQIHQKYNQIQKDRKIDDRTLIQNFSDHIYVPKQVSDIENNTLFNNLLSKLSKSIRRII